MTAKIVKGDLLNCDAQFIAHQCNCISNGVAGLAAAIFEKYPSANIYKERSLAGTWHKPGELYVKYQCLENSTNFSKSVVNVINMTSQFSPGPPGMTFEIAPGIVVTETAEVREKLFLECLKRISELVDVNCVESIGFPYGIGCGLGGGNWERYKYVLDRFANKMKNKNVEIIIVKKY